MNIRVCRDMTDLFYILLPFPRGISPYSYQVGIGTRTYAYIHCHTHFDPEDGNSMCLRNIGNTAYVGMVQRPNTRTSQLCFHAQFYLSPDYTQCDASLRRTDARP
jgi:hypothetical protein